MGRASIEVSLGVRKAMVKEGEICTFELTTSSLKSLFSLVALGALESQKPCPEELWHKENVKMVYCSRVGALQNKPVHLN